LIKRSTKILCYYYRSISGEEDMEKVLCDAAQDDGDPPNAMPGHFPNEKEAFGNVRCIVKN
jgi:hypothetical protein